MPNYENCILKIKQALRDKIAMAQLNSEIQRFFSGQTIFLTGGTGFLGKLLIEKLLRTCSNLNKLYILVRPKKGRSIETRYDEIFSTKIFDLLKEQCADDFIKSKVHLIAGDCERVNLGLEPSDEKMLIEEVTCVIHGAATVNFHAHLRVAAYINVRAVQDLLKLAGKMTQLKAFVHISTLFSNCYRKDIDEQFYDVPINADKLLTLVDMLDDDTLTSITPQLLGKWPNSYVFTKSIAEDLIKTKGSNLPVAITRPPSIISTVDDPVPGWIDNRYGPTGIVMGIGLGVIKSCNGDPQKTAQIMPADFVVNLTLAVASEVQNQRKNNGQIPIYNYTLSKINSMTWGRYIYGMKANISNNNNFSKAIWCPDICLTKNSLRHKINAFFFHTIFSYLLEVLLLMLIQKRTFFVKSYRKIATFMDEIKYFALRDWTFHDNNVQELLAKQNDLDRQLFNFNMSNLDWDKYFAKCACGMRVYLANDPPDTLPQANRKIMVFRIIDFIIKAVFWWMVYKLFKFVFYSCLLPK